MSKKSLTRLSLSILAIACLLAALAAQATEGQADEAGKLKDPANPHFEADRWRAAQQAMAIHARGDT